MTFNHLFSLLGLPLIVGAVILDAYLHYNREDKYGKGRITVRYRRWAFRRFEQSFRDGRPKFILMLVAGQASFARTTQAAILWILSAALTVPVFFVSFWPSPWGISYGASLIALGIDDLLTDSGLRKRLLQAARKFVWRLGPQPVAQPVRV